VAVSLIARSARVAIGAFASAESLASPGSVVDDVSDAVFVRSGCSVVGTAFEGSEPWTMNVRVAPASRVAEAASSPLTGKAVSGVQPVPSQNISSWRRESTVSVNTTSCASDGPPLVSTIV